MAFALAIHESDRGDVIRLTLTGDLDMASAPMLEDRLEELRAQHRAVRLDLSRLQFMDSTGVHILVRAVDSASSEGFRVAVERDVSRQAMRLIELLNLRRLFEDDGPNCG